MTVKKRGEHSKGREEVESAFLTPWPTIVTLRMQLELLTKPPTGVPALLEKGKELATGRPRKLDCSINLTFSNLSLNFSLSIFYFSKTFIFSFQFLSISQSLAGQNFSFFPTFPHE